MLRLVRILALMLPLLLPVSCNKAWRGDGPPSVLEKSVWIGTNQARNEILELRFGFEGDVSRVESEDGSTVETGRMEMVFHSPADTVMYEGTYSYRRWPSSVSGDVFHGSADMKLTEADTGESVNVEMTFHNQRFFISFRGSSYPADRAEDSCISNLQ